MTTITVTSAVKDSPGAGQITIVGTYADQTFSNPAQRTTVNEFPTGNPRWARNLRLTDAAMFILRNGANGVALLASSLSKIALALEPTLTWTPRVTTQPAADTTTFAKATLTSNNTNVSDADTVTIGNKTYTFKTTLTPTEGEVLIGASADASLLNLIRAVNHSGTPDTDYSCAAAHTQVTAATAVTAHAFLLTSKTVGTASNAYASTETAATLSFGGATFSGGVAAATFVVVVTSELTTTYAWYESADGVTYGSALASSGIYSGATSATLTITPTDTTKNGYYYKCIATNAAGTTTTDAAVLTVT